MSKNKRMYRDERLKSRREIQRLFSKKSQSLSAYPLRLVYNKMETKDLPFRFQAPFVVPKRRFRKAVDRNLLKRRTKEAYRLHKSNLFAVSKGAEDIEPQDSYALMFIYVGREPATFHTIEKKMLKLLHQLVKRI